MPIDDAITRISQIDAQLSELRSGVVPSAPGSAGVGAAGAASTAGPAGTSGPMAVQTNFATALAQAQGVTGASGVSGVAGTPPGSQLPAAAGTSLTSGQQQFASRLAADTGLSPSVVCAWLMAEENGTAAVSRQSASNNDWLNIGYTDSGTYGSSDSVWSDPISAADATAGWLKGQNTVPGYGTASAGIQAILSVAGQGPAAQVAAIQSSGWASSGYPDLPSLLTQFGG
jgi:hypothetical protein